MNIGADLKVAGGGGLFEGGTYFVVRQCRTLNAECKTPNDCRVIGVRKVSESSSR